MIKILYFDQTWLSGRRIKTDNIRPMCSYFVLYNMSLKTYLRGNIFFKCQKKSLIQKYLGPISQRGFQ